MSRFSRVVFSKKSGLWKTPEEAFAELNREFHFNFDPCVPPVVGDFNGNGLQEEWPKGCRAFLNPDYDKAERWVLKSWLEYTQKRAKLAVLLLPGRIDTDWFDFISDKAAEIRRAKRRLRFKGAKYDAPFPSIVVIIK